MNKIIMVAEELYGELHHSNTMQLQNKVGMDITEIPAQTKDKIKENPWCSDFHA